MTVGYGCWCTVWFVGRKIYRWRKGLPNLTRGMTNETSPLFWKSIILAGMILTAILALLRSPCRCLRQSFPAKDIRCSSMLTGIAAVARDDPAKEHAP